MPNENENPQEYLKRMISDLLSSIVSPQKVERIEPEAEPEIEQPGIPRVAFCFIAKTVRAMLDAFVSEGFNEDQAYELSYMLFEKTLSDSIAKRGEN